jgi:hypothetical protein
VSTPVTAVRAWNSFGFYPTYVSGSQPAGPQEPIKAGVILTGGPLQLTKTVTGAAAQYAPTSFQADVSCTVGGVAVALGAKASVTLSAANQYTARIDGIPSGAECAIAEHGADGSYGESSRSVTPGTITIAAADATAPVPAGRLQSVVSADLNGDGRADLVRVTRAGRATVKAGDGLGHYKKVVVRDNTSFVGRSLITSVGDLNGDHHNDLVARIDSGKGAGKLALYLGKGNGTFKRVARPVKTVGATQILAPGDVSGDGKPDLIVRTAASSTLYRGAGTGRFAAGTPYVATAGRVGTPIDTGLNLPSATQLMNAGDWNRDGNADLISRNTDGNLYLYLGNGQGRFAPGTLLAGGFGAVTLLSAGGDITGDGYPDLQGQVNGAMRIYPGRGAAGLAASYVSHSAISGKKQVAVGLWTADGAPDAIFVNAKSTVLYPGNGPGGLTNPVTIGGSLTGYSWVIGVSNMRGTGKSALIVRDAAGSLYEIDPTATGMLGTPQLLGSGYSGYDLADG